MTSFVTRLCLPALASVSVLMSSTAFAQTVTGPADASRVQERARRTPDLLPPTPKVEVRQAASANAPAGAEKIKLKLSTVIFDGATVYSEKELKSLYGSQIGQNISLADVYALANVTTTKYRNDGYVLTQVVVPPQTIEGGNIRLQVVEGYIENVTVEGVAKDSERELIKALSDRAKASKPLNIRDLEQALLLINDLPGATARGVLSPAKAVGAADLRVIVERQAYEGSVGVDNFGSRFLGAWELNGAIAANSLLGMNERIASQLIYAPEHNFDKELAYGDLSYLQPVGNWGTTVELFGSLTSTDPGHTLREFEINGRSVFFSAKVDQPIIRTRAFNWNLYGLLDWRNVDTDSNIEPTRTDHIRMGRIGTDVDFLDTVFGAGYNNLNVEVAKGLDILDASEQGDANMSRALGDPQGSKIEAEYQRLQRITKGVNLLFGVKGQHATDAMLSSEEFGIGGPTYGRGYDPSEIVGDHGVAGKLEVQWNEPWAMQMVDTYQLYGFLDGGRVWNSDATTSADKKISLASTGLGMRVTFPAQTQAGLYVAVPLNRDVQAENDQDARLYFNLSQPF
jgi:hemolysin activation/secretion protein